jgi:hypothetical protein
MVPHTGKAPRADTLKLVNRPEPVVISADAHGQPVKIDSRQVSAIEDCWRIDDEWWRKQPIARLYYAVMLSNGSRMTVYRDLLTGSWYRQLY